MLERFLRPGWADLLFGSCHLCPLLLARSHASFLLSRRRSLSQSLVGRAKDHNIPRRTRNNSNTNNNQSLLIYYHHHLKSWKQKVGETFSGFHTCDFVFYLSWLSWSPQKGGFYESRFHKPHSAHFLSPRFRIYILHSKPKRKKCAPRRTRLIRAPLEDQDHLFHHHLHHHVHHHHPQITIAIVRHEHRHI